MSGIFIANFCQTFHTVKQCSALKMTWDLSWEWLQASAEISAGFRTEAN